MSSPAPINISIYGSCVSRDTLEYSDHSKIAIKRYIARQSLLSAFLSKSPADLDLSNLSSPFQKRMVQNDLNNTLRSQLQDVANDSDLFLWDLTDERLGVYTLPTGAVITRSLELIASGQERALQQSGRLVEFGTNEHYALWIDALNTFEQRLNELGLRNRTRLIRIPWAAKYSNGRKISVKGLNLDPRIANRRFGRYYRSAEKVVPIVNLPPFTRPRASLSHRWGHAPFHYTDTTYTELIRQLHLPPK